MCRSKAIDTASACDWLKAEGIGPGYGTGRRGVDYYLLTQHNVEGVQNAGEPHETTQHDVDPEHGTEAALHEDGQGRQEEGCG